MLSEHWQEGAQAFLNTEHKNYSESLLVDTGAFENLMGSKWLERIERIKKASRSKSSSQPVEWESLNNPIPVGGVGKDVINAKWRAKVPIALKGGKKTSYEALFLEDNGTPALLGTKALQGTNAILDLRRGRLHLYCSENENFVVTKGNSFHKMQLDHAGSGHILLPCTDYDE